jgi:hypothetical protein
LDGLEADGFGEVIVHAGGEAAFAVADHGAGGHGDDDAGGALLGLLEAADLAGGFEAVHSGIWTSMKTMP